MKSRYRWLAAVFLILGVALRTLLFSVNPPWNAFDNHFKPIEIMMATGGIPDKFQCWECYQPPVFYALSAVLGKILLAAHVGIAALQKVLQFVNFLYNVGTLGVVYLILRRLRLTALSRLLGLGLICFLPRHIYMAAVHSNDNLSYLGIAVCIYLLLQVIQEKRDSLPHLLLLSGAVTGAIFTKYTAFVLIPAIAVAFFLAPLGGKGISLAQALKKAVVVLALPLVLLSVYSVHNIQRYGAALPFNTALYDPLKKQPHDENVRDFASFKPWLYMEHPILRPGQLNSFWTLMYAGMWFDSEPHFIIFTGQKEWYREYFNWLKGRIPYSDQLAASAPESLMRVGSLLEIAGIIPLVVGVYGLFSLVARFKQQNHPDYDLISTFQPFYTVLFLVFLIAMKLASDLPVYSAIKSSYVLGAVPAFCAFTAAGIDAIGNARLRYLLVALMGTVFLLSSIHIVQLVSCWNL